MSKSSSSQVMSEAEQGTAILSGQQYVTDVALEGLYSIPRKTLQNWRVLGRGPKFRKFGSGVRYKIADVEAWVNSLPTGGAGVPSSAVRTAR